MENTNKTSEIIEAIEFVLCIGQLSLIASKKDGKDVGEADIKKQHKENCEMLEAMLKDSITITDYVKFAEMIQRCDMALILGALTKDTDTPKRMISDIIDKLGSGCMRLTA